MPGLAGASGVVLSGALTQGPGWRWIFYLNVPVALLAGIGAFALIAGERRGRRRSSFDLSGAVLVTAGMLLLIYTFVQAPDVGWASARTLGGLAAAAVILAAFAANERRARNPLVPFSIFRIEGLAAANLTQLITFAGLYSMFFFLSLYMQNVLGYPPIHTGLAYLPLTGGFMVAAAIATPLLPRVGTRPVIVAGALLAAAGIYYLSRAPVHGTFLSDLLPGIVVIAIGAGAVFTGVTTAATEGVPSDKAGIASGLLNASMQFGGALGLAVLSAAATDRTNTVLQRRRQPPTRTDRRLPTSLSHRHRPRARRRAHRLHGHQHPRRRGTTRGHLSAVAGRIGSTGEHRPGLPALYHRLTRAATAARVSCPSSTPRGLDNQPTGGTMAKLSDMRTRG